MICLEGLDNTGKTRLAQRIAEVYGYPLVPGIGNKHDTEEIHRLAHQSVEFDGVYPHRVYDRSRFLSEYIYRPILKDRPFAFDQQHYFDFMRVYLSRPQLLIYCTRPMSRVKAGFDDREQLGGVYGKLTELHWAYERVMGFLAHMFSLQLNGSQIIMWDFGKMNFADDIGPAVRQYAEAVG